MLNPSSCPTEAAMTKNGVHMFKHKAGKSKRMRTSFTNEQLSRLEKEFARQQYMVGSERFLLATSLQLTEAQVSHHTQLCLFSLLHYCILYTRHFDTIFHWSNPLLHCFIRLRSGSRIVASNGASRVWSSSKQNWLNSDLLLRQRVPVPKGMRTRGTKRKISATNRTSTLRAPSATAKVIPWSKNKPKNCCK